MARSRLGVVLLVPPPTDGEVDGLRRACGDGALLRVAPHLTLVPPTNVRADALPAALAVVRRAAAGRGRPLRLVLGPPATFLPDSATLHLAVGGGADEVAGLGRLRAAASGAPLDRPAPWPFVPHVTLADEADPDRIAAGLVALADYRAEVVLGRVHVLREEERPGGGRWWVPVADWPLRPPAVVGRGGLPLELAPSELVDPEAAAFEAAEGPGAPAPGHAVPALGTPGRAALAGVGGAGGPAGRSVAVVARRRGAVVGLARGWAAGGEAEVHHVVVAADHRGQGIARHLVAALDHEAAVLAAPGPDGLDP